MNSRRLLLGRSIYHVEKQVRQRTTQQKTFTSPLMNANKQQAKLETQVENAGARKVAALEENQELQKKLERNLEKHEEASEKLHTAQAEV